MNTPDDLTQRARELADAHDLSSKQGWATAARQQAREMRDTLRALADERERLREALHVARSAMMEPHGDWKDVRENKAIVVVRQALFPKEPTDGD